MILNAYNEFCCLCENISLRSEYFFLTGSKVRPFFGLPKFSETPNFLFKKILPLNRNFVIWYHKKNIIACSNKCTTLVKI